MIVDAVFNNDFIAGLPHIEISRYVCGVIDVIRATTTISVMLAQGSREVVIAKNRSSAFSLKKIYKDYLLCGEEGGHPPEGFDFGNSPLEYSLMDLHGNGTILKTTNGTKSFFKTAGSLASFALSLVNISYTCDAMINEAEPEGADILLVCSGEKGKTAYDDAYAAGVAARILKEKKKNIILSDAALILYNLALNEKSSFEALKNSTSYRSMVKAGLGEDIKICSMQDLYRITGKLYWHEKKEEQNFNDKGSIIKKAVALKDIYTIKPYTLQ